MYLSSAIEFRKVLLLGKCSAWFGKWGWGLAAPVRIPLSSLPLSIPLLGA
jgi:hypothetical protein